MLCERIESEGRRFTRRLLAADLELSDSSCDYPVHLFLGRWAFCSSAVRDMDIEVICADCL